MDIKIDDYIWHPCNMDIIRHKVIAIHTYSTVRKGVTNVGTQYTLKAVHNVGACGKIEVIISENNGKLRFIELVDEDDIEYASGLQDFVEGNYYTSETEAKLEFYKQQEILCGSSTEKHRQLYENSKKNYERVKLLVKELRDNLKTK